MKSHLKTIIQVAFFSLLFLFIMIQLFPYGREHSNPKVIAEPPWDSPKTRATFMKACADCHSNETQWPWYSHVAPVSWLVQDDVTEGRSHLNISEWGTRKFHGDEAAEEVEKGEMPLSIYVFTHPEANLTAGEKEQFIQGLKETFGGESEEQEYEEEQ